MKNSKIENDSDFDENPQENETDANQDGNSSFRVIGREGKFSNTTSVHDKYAARPKGVNDLTLSQFATSYTKCGKKPKKVKFNKDDVSDEKGCIFDHLTGLALPKHIKLSTNEIYYLRKFSNVLRIHSSSKKTGEEQYFAEMQLFSPWHPHHPANMFTLPRNKLKSMNESPGPGCCCSDRCPPW